MGRGRDFIPLCPTWMVRLASPERSCQGKTFDFSWDSGWVGCGRRVVEITPLRPTGWCYGVGSAGTVVLHGLRNPGLDLSDPRRFRRMGGQELGRALAPLRSLGHPMPEVERRVRVVARLGHEDEAEMVGLRLLGAAPGQDQPHRGSCAEECGRLPNERGIVACQRDLGG